MSVNEVPFLLRHREIKHCTWAPPLVNGRSGVRTWPSGMGLMQRLRNRWPGVTGMRCCPGPDFISPTKEEQGWVIPFSTQMALRLKVSSNGHSLAPGVGTSLPIPSCLLPPTPSISGVTGWEGHSLGRFDVALLIKIEIEYRPIL